MEKYFSESVLKGMKQYGTQNASAATRLAKAYKDLSASQRFDKSLHERLIREMETESDPEMKAALKKEIERQKQLPGYRK